MLRDDWDDMDDDERAALYADLEESLADADSGRTRPSEDILREIKDVLSDGSINRLPAIDGSGGSAPSIHEAEDALGLCRTWGRGKRFVSCLEFWRDFDWIRKQ